MPAIKTVGIVTKHNLPEARKLASDAATFLKKLKVKVFLSGRISKEDLIKKCDLILVLGGDGTFISVARRMIARSVPLLGVNMGQLGFLTEVKKSEMYQALHAALKGELQVSHRTMLECSLTRNGKLISKNPIVNDIVVSRGAIARIFDLQVLVDDLLVTNMKADGLIISTPTGSTAYCLAAGGPIVAPNVPAMAIAPICPHSLTLRPLIIPDTSVIKLVPDCRGGSVILTLDGQTSLDIKTGDVIKITKYKKHPLKILHSLERDYYSLLREKLKYGYRD
ncbi:MAG: NAD(+)/NADH kinase [Bdellovibrionota bacterium]